MHLNPFSSVKRIDLLIFYFQKNIIYLYSILNRTFFERECTYEYQK